MNVMVRLRAHTNLLYFRTFVEIQVLRGDRVLHHGLVKSGGTFKLDGLQCGSAVTVLDVVDWCSSVQPGWPTPLRQVCASPSFVTRFPLFHSSGNMTET